MCAPPVWDEFSGLCARPIDDTSLVLPQGELRSRPAKLIHRLKWEPA